MRPRDLIKGSQRLLALPDVFIRVNQMVDDPRYSALDIGKAIARDPALTARLLQLANSAFYGFPSRIDTVSRAVTVIGTRGLRDLILISSSVDIFRSVSGHFLDGEKFWQHSLYCGVLARALAARSHLLHSEPLFVAGLLHDIGQLIMIHKLPEMAREAHLRSKDTSTPLHRVEEEVMGFNHAQVGAELLRAWHLPEGVVEAVEYHHHPTRTKSAPIVSALVYIANAVASRRHPLATQDGRVAQAIALETEVPDEIWRITGVTAAELPAIIEAAEGQYGQLHDIILPRVA